MLDLTSCSAPRGTVTGGTEDGSPCLESGHTHLPCLQMSICYACYASSRYVYEDTSGMAMPNMSQTLPVRAVNKGRCAASRKRRTCSILVFDSGTGTRLQVCQKRIRPPLNSLERQTTAGSVAKPSNSLTSGIGVSSDLTHRIAPSSHDDCASRECQRLGMLPVLWPISPSASCLFLVIGAPKVAAFRKIRSRTVESF